MINKKLMVAVLFSTATVLNTMNVFAMPIVKLPIKPIEPFPFYVQEKLRTIEMNNQIYNIEPIIKYANKEAAIYDRPIEDEVFIHDYSLLNTSFEVIEETNVWDIITTSDGIAYIKSEDLSIEMTEETKEKTYSEEELWLMAHLLAGEAQFCSDDEQRRVGSVVLNRVNHKDFPNTLKEVIFQKGQYSCTKDGNFYREPTEHNWENARWLLENGSVFPGNVIYQSGSPQGVTYYQSEWHYFGY